MCREGLIGLEMGARRKKQNQNGTQEFRKKDNKMKGKKLLAGVLSAAMVLSTMALPVFADDNANTPESKTNAEVNGSKYTTLNAAVEAAGNGETVKLLSNTTESIKSNKNFTLDLNGYTLKNEENKNTIENYGNLTIIDSSDDKTGTVNNVSHAKAALYNYEGGIVIINGGTLNRSQDAGIDGAEIRTIHIIQ